MTADKSSQGVSAGTHAELGAAAPGAPLADRIRLSAGAPGGAIVSALPDGPASGVELAPKRGRGRPQGATNIKETAVAQALIKTYGNPLEADLAIGNCDIGGLITLLRVIASDRGLKLGMTIGEIVRWQADCRRNALPYLMGKRAPTNEKGETVLPIIGLGSASGAAVPGVGQSIEDVIDAETVSDQSVSEEGD